MSIFKKLRPDQYFEPPRRTAPPGRGSVTTATSAAPLSAPLAGSSSSPGAARLSNGLKEFLWQLEGIGHGHLVDLGPARQTTITFFIDRGFKVYSEDLLESWKIFLHAEEQRERALPADADRSELTPASRAERYLESVLKYPPNTFDAVLAWDLLDYLDTEVVPRLVTRLTSVVREGGVLLAMFHARKPEAFHRYRVLDAHNLELIPASCPFAPQRVFQNREISNLFRRFHSSKTFVGRDQIREGLFVK
jgi:hypothetical protein